MGNQQQLWQFALKFYSERAVSTQLLKLQNDAQMSVNQLIYAVWLASVSYRLLSLPDENEQVAVWRSQVVIPLRTLRFELRASKDSFSQQGGAVEASYQQLLAAELAAERAELDLLAADIDSYAKPHQGGEPIEELVRQNLVYCWQGRGEGIKEPDLAYQNLAVLDHLIELSISFLNS